MDLTQMDLCTVIIFINSFISFLNMNTLNAQYVSNVELFRVVFNMTLFIITQIMFMHSLSTTNDNITGALSVINTKLDNTYSLLQVIDEELFDGDEEESEDGEEEAKDADAKDDVKPELPVSDVAEASSTPEYTSDDKEAAVPSVEDVVTNTSNTGPVRMRKAFRDIAVDQ